jgi:hypothetical protein
MTQANESRWKELEAVCAKDPQDLVSCFLAGVLAHYLARHEDCVTRMTSLLQKLPGQPRVPMYAAISAFYLGRQKEAETWIDQAVRIAGATDPDVYYCRSIIRRKTDVPGAIDDLERFLRVASRGWHSEGKIGRVREELDSLRRGVIPEPKEWHHRPAAAAGTATEPAPAQGEGAPPGSGAETGEGEEAFSGWAQLAVVLLATLFFMIPILRRWSRERRP